MLGRTRCETVCACLRICCGSSWRTDRAASARWPWRSARWAPTSCPSTSSSAPPGYAIDDLVVDLPPGAMPDMLITAAEKLNGVYVDTIRPHTGLLEAHRELELIDHVAAADGKHEEAAGARRRGAAGAARRMVHGGSADRIGTGAHRAAATAPPRPRPRRRRGCHSTTPKPWTAPPTGCRSCGGTWTPRWPPRRSAITAPQSCWAGRAARVPAVGGGPAGLPGRDRRDDLALTTRHYLS